MNAPVRPAAEPELLRLRVDDFLLLADHGAFDDYSKTELIDGVIYFMDAQHSRHARIKSRLAFELGLKVREIGSDLEVISEVTVRVADDSAPEPDIVLTRFRGDRDVPGDTVALAVEVAETTLGIDLGRKAMLYAAAAIPEYWVVDLNGGRVLIHHEARLDGYVRRDEVALGERLRSATLDWLTIDTAVLIA